MIDLFYIKREIFKLGISNIVYELAYLEANGRALRGVCNLLASTFVKGDAAGLFSKLYQDENYGKHTPADKPFSSYWLGPLYGLGKEEGYTRRIEYLLKFQEHCLKTKAYKKFI